MWLRRKIIGLRKQSQTDNTHCTAQRKTYSNTGKKNNRFHLCTLLLIGCRFHLNRFMYTIHYNIDTKHYKLVRLEFKIGMR